MLRRFADLVYQHLLNSFPGGRAYPRTLFECDDMPAPIAHYLVQALETRLSVELARVRQTDSPWIDLEHPEVAAALQSLSASLTRAGQFPSDEWSTALERAVRNVVSYHVRPARTLVDFLFVREDDQYTVEGLQHKLEFFLPYPHLNDVIEEYVRQAQQEEIGRETVTMLVHQIDEQMREDVDVDAWSRMLEPLFEIASVLPEYREEVPVELLIAFFRDRGIARVERHLERLHEEEGLDGMEMPHVLQVLEEARRPPVRASHAVRHERVIRPETATVASTQPQPESLRPPSQTGPVPLWQQFQQAPQAQPPRAAAPGPADEPAEERPLWMRFSEENPNVVPARGDSPDVAPLSELEYAVLGQTSSASRNAFVRALFRGSVAAYRESLEQLSGAGTWPEASRIIADQVFRAHQVDIYSEAAVTFTNAVEARYEAS